MTRISRKTRKAADALSGKRKKFPKKLFKRHDICNISSITRKRIPMRSSSFVPKDGGNPNRLKFSPLQSPNKKPAFSRPEVFFILFQVVQRLSPKGRWFLGNLIGFIAFYRSFFHPPTAFFMSRQAPNCLLIFCHYTRGRDLCFRFWYFEIHMSNVLHSFSFSKISNSGVLHFSASK